MLTLMCFIEVCSGENCKINSGVEYLKTVPFVKLHSEDPDIILPVPCVEYSIPDISEILADKTRKMGKELNICPPVALAE